MTKDGELRHHLSLRPSRTGYIVTIDYKTKPGSPEDFRTVIQPIMDEMNRSLATVMENTDEDELDRLVREANSGPKNARPFDPAAFVHPSEACGDYCFPSLWEAMDFIARCLHFITYPEEGMGRLIQDLKVMDQQKASTDSK